MKPLMTLLGASVLGSVLLGCAQSSPPVAETGRPYAAYAYNSDYRGPENSRYRNWTTAQLQQRRKDLYYMVPQRYSRNGVPEYISSGPQLPQQDEIRAIEGELNRRYHAGDKSALLQPTWPEERRHI